MPPLRPPTEAFWQFCAALNRYDVDYVVIGSEAVAFHGIKNKRASGRPKDLADVDLLTSDDPDRSPHE